MSRLAAILCIIAALPSQVTHAEVWAWKTLPDPRGEFVRLCAPHLVGRFKQPESICLCLHDYALATVSDSDMREALMRGISDTGTPTIENAWIPREKRPLINAVFNTIAQPTSQCMFAPQLNR